MQRPDFNRWPRVSPPLGRYAQRALESWPDHPDRAGVWPAVPVRGLPPILTEVDARSVGEHGGTVTLYLSVAADDQHYVVDVESAFGESVARITAATRAEALEAYRHPFARLDVPDIFSEAA